MCIRDSFNDTKVIDDVGAYRSLLVRWLLEITIMFELHKTSAGQRRKYPRILDDEDFCALTEMEPPGSVSDEDQVDKPRTTSQWKAIFKRRLDKARESKVDTGLPLFRNISLLSEMLKLGAADQTLLAFSAALILFPLFRSCIASINLAVSNQLLHRILARLSGLKETDFQAATSDSGVLISSGLVKVANGTVDLENKVILFKGIANAMLASNASTEELTSRFLKRAALPTLKLDNFPHLATDTSILLKYLQKAISSRATGVNILLYGKPGVGKSEYVQVLAAALGVELYEIAFADIDGDPIKGADRLQAFVFCQNLLSRNENALLIFDEIEDVFPGGNSFARLFGSDEGTDTVGKAWINRSIERNQVPAMWVSNRINQIDTAFLRRFDYSVQFPTPPASVRLSIAQHHLGCFEPPISWLERIAASEDLTPGQLERAAKVARLTGNESSSETLKMIERVLERSSYLLNTKNIPGRVLPKTGYSLDFLNTDVDITAVIAGLKRRASGSFCFYGPAGTGKSELARHIADNIGRPYLLRRASDILDKYVGESEKNIAAMFSEARQQDAVLVLDEADSFLADRNDAQRSWEVTQVNELLTQIESFEGVFICTTNLMDRLDAQSVFSGQ